jgi:hypothetical protein
MYNYLKYSGASVILSLNPLHWKILPWYRNEATEDDWSVGTHAVGFLFLTVRFWIDNGDW